MTFWTKKWQTKEQLNLQTFFEDADKAIGIR
jgi:hypothetical protein